MHKPTLVLEHRFNTHTYQAHVHCNIWGFHHMNMWVCEGHAYRPILVFFGSCSRLVYFTPVFDHVALRVSTKLSA